MKKEKVVLISMDTMNLAQIMTQVETEWTSLIIIMWRATTNVVSNNLYIYIYIYIVESQIVAQIQKNWGISPIGPIQ